MSIRRAFTPADHFTIIPNAWVRDARLSWKARGLLAYLMSHSVGWSSSIESLVRAGLDGRDAVRSGIAELEAAGYLRRSRARDAQGRLGEADYDVVDPDNPASAEPPSENPTEDGPPPKKNNELEDQSQEHQVLPRSKPRKPIPDEWQPSLDHRSRAAGYGVDCDHEAEMFRAHALSNDRRQADWNGAFTTWLGKARERTGNNRRLTNAERGMAEAAAERARERARDDQGLLALLGGPK